MTLPKPYYQDDAVQIYLGDCRDILPELPKVDLVLTDPPYGIGIDGCFKDDFSQCENLNIVNANILCSFMSPRQLHRFMNILTTWNFERCLWWYKSSDMAWPWRSWCMNSEAILIFSRDDTKWPQIEIKARRDFYDLPFSGGKNGHPAAKPTYICEDIIQRLSDNLILDPFMGSGTTLRAAKNLGRKAIVIEIEEKYCEIAAKRMAQTVMELVI